MYKNDHNSYQFYALFENVCNCIFQNIFEGVSVIKIFFCSHIVLLKYEGVFNFDSIKWHLSNRNFYHLTGIFLSSINVLISKVR